MKWILGLWLLMAALPAQAVQFVVYNPCHADPWLATAVAMTPGVNVGQLTIATLTAQNIPFVGAERGINSINGTPTGDAALEVLSDRELRAYGWCFHLNGQEPGHLANEVMLASERDVIEWFFAYAHYLDGAWVAMCVPTHLERPAFICE